MGGRSVSFSSPDLWLSIGLIGTAGLDAGLEEGSAQAQAGAHSPVCCRHHPNSLLGVTVAGSLMSKACASPAPDLSDGVALLVARVDSWVAWQTTAQGATAGTAA